MGVWGLGGGISRGRSFLEFLLSRGKRTVAGGWSAFVKQRNNTEKDDHSWLCSDRHGRNRLGAHVGTGFFPPYMIALSPFCFLVSCIMLAKLGVDSFVYPCVHFFFFFIFNNNLRGSSVSVLLSPFKVGEIKTEFWYLQLIPKVILKQQNL